MSIYFHRKVILNTGTVDLLFYPNAGVLLVRYLLFIGIMGRTDLFGVTFGMCVVSDFGTPNGNFSKFWAGIWDH
jgi:hypothetical protein